jgi:iron-sulfur cluster assembly protein
MKKFINITPDALKFLKESVASEPGSQGIRIDIKSGGCRGMTYELKSVKEINPSDILLKEDGVSFYISSKAMIFVSNMTMDYVKTSMGGSIVFDNPNAKMKCGCGKSFSIDGSEGVCSTGCCH